MSNYSCNDNQNYFVEAGRTTSRVLAPPGGKTSICLGGGYEETKTKPVVAAAPSPPAVVPAPPASATTSTATAVAPPKAAVVCSQAEPQPVSANAFASGSNMNGAQVMTGRPTSRVLAPPGGHTSIKLW